MFLVASMNFKDELFKIAFKINTLIYLIKMIILSNYLNF